MEYTVQKLAELAGISTRTLRYYDQIGLLAPAGRLDSGYRVYGEAEVDVLQQILFYRELGLELSEIKKLVTDPHFNRMSALKEHLKKLESRKQQLTIMIETVSKTILQEEGLITMTDAEKFKGLKEELIRKNEEQYGEEIRRKYGTEAAEKSNAKMMNLTEEQYHTMEALGKELKELLQEAVTLGADPSGEFGEKAVKLHKDWLSFTWPAYSKEAYQGLVLMYVEDERFKRYYDDALEGCAGFLKAAADCYA